MFLRLFLLAWMWQWPQRLRRCCKAKQEPKEEPVEEVLEQPVEDMRLKNASVTEFVFEGGASFRLELMCAKDFEDVPSTFRATHLHVHSNTISGSENRGNGHP